MSICKPLIICGFCNCVIDVTANNGKCPNSNCPDREVKEDKKRKLDDESC